MTHERILKDRYFRWLSEFVGVYSEEDLLRQLHDTPFIWVIPIDVNRAEDGRELRERILSDHRVDPTLVDLGEASILEVLAALSQRASFVWDEHSLEDWFQIFLDNLGIKNVCHEEVVADTLEDWMTRNISASGQGGLFPLRHPPSDQRTTEIWYQMSAYIQEDMEAVGFFD